MTEADARAFISQTGSKSATRTLRLAANRWISGANFLPANQCHRQSVLLYPSFRLSSEHATNTKRIALPAAKIGLVQPWV